MSRQRNFINSPFVLWVLLAIPGLVLTQRYLSGVTYYGQFVHATGEFSARLLMLTLLLTPLSLLWPKRRWVRWLLVRRRYFGVAAFAYAVPHLVAYLVKLGSFDRIVEDGSEPGIFVGWIAFLIFFALAVTSNDASVRTLRGRWKSLHRWVYVAAVLTFAHWVLVAFDPTTGFVHAAVLALFEVFRVWKTRRSGVRPG